MCTHPTDLDAYRAHMRAQFAARRAGEAAESLRLARECESFASLLDDGCCAVQPTDHAKAGFSLPLSARLLRARARGHRIVAAIEA